MNINTKRMLKEYLLEEKKNYDISFKSMLFGNSDYCIWKFQKLLRKEEYYYNAKKRIRYILIKAVRQRLGIKLGFSIPINVFDIGLFICHYGSIVVHGNARIGKKCILHGNNCIGNDGKQLLAAPIIGDNVDIGFGAILIGGITISDNIKIGCGCVVVKSQTLKNKTIVGVPGKAIN